MSKLIHTNKFIRRLDFKEVGLIKRGWDQNVIVRYRMKTNLDIFEDAKIELFKKAIFKVVQSEEFLKSCIVKTGESEYFYRPFDFNRYNFENVKFLRQRSNSNTRNSSEMNMTISDMVCEYLAVNEINPDKADNTLLWRYYFYEIENHSIYDLIAQYHHVMVQGPISTQIFMKIMTTFEMFYANRDVEFKESKIYLGSDRLTNAYEHFKSQPTSEPIKRPSCVDPERAKSISLSQQAPIGLDMNAEVFCVSSKTKFESVANLVETSRVNHVKPKFWILNDWQVKKLVTRCKKEGVKLNSTLELVMCLAVSKLLRSLGATDEESTELVYHTVISLRDGQRTGQDTLNQNTLGLISGGLIVHPNSSDIREIQNSKNEKRWNEIFWRVAKKQSVEMHHRLKHDPSRFGLKLKPAAEDEINFHFSSSNIGVIEIKDFENFEFFDYSSLCTLDADSRVRLFFLWFVTEPSGQKLMCGIHHNSHLIEVSAMNKFIQLFNCILNDLVKHESVLLNR